jgi:sugar phosphate isomerase/epimerase
MWTFGISECTTKPWTFERDVERYPALGARAIEIWESKLARDWPTRAAQLAAPAARGLSVSSFQAEVHSLFPTRMTPQPRAFAARRDAIVRVLETCGPALPGTVFVLNTGVAPEGDVQRAFEQTVAAYGTLAHRAAALGVRLALEPLHPLAMNEDSFAWTLEDALDIVDAVGDDALGVCADAWNLAGQHELRARVAACGTKLFLVQVSDWRRPRSFLDRLPVGDGTLDLLPFLHGVRDARYDGAIVLEIFSDGVPDSLYERDLDAAVLRSRHALSDLLAEPPRRAQQA